MYFLKLFFITNIFFLKILNIIIFGVISFIITILLLDEPIWILNTSTDTHIFSDFLITTHISSAILTFFYFYITIIFFFKNNIRFLFIFFGIIHTKISLFFCLINLFSGIIWGLPIWGVSLPLEDSRLLFILIYLLFLLLFLTFILNNNLNKINWNLIYILYISSLLIIPIIKFIITHWSTLHQPDLILGLYFEGINISFLLYIYLVIYIIISIYIYKETIINSILNKFIILN